jgi:hypothetical protein
MLEILEVEDNEEGKPTRWNYLLPEHALLTDCSTVRVKTTKLKLNVKIPLECWKKLSCREDPRNSSDATNQTCQERNVFRSQTADVGN